MNNQARIKEQNDLDARIERAIERIKHLEPGDTIDAFFLRTVLKEMLSVPEKEHSIHCAKNSGLEEYEHKCTCSPTKSPDSEVNELYSDILINNCQDARQLAHRLYVAGWRKSSPKGN